MTSPQTQNSHRTMSRTVVCPVPQCCAGKFKNLNWHGKTAVVCGGSSGLGLTIAKELVRQAIGHLILIARTPEHLEKAVEQIQLNLPDLQVANPQATIQSTEHQQFGELATIPNNTQDFRITTITADMIDSSSVQRAAQTIQAVALHVDLVIQAVGASDRGTIAGLTRERLYQLIDTNVVTSLHAIQQLSPLFQKRGGVIVLVGSLSSFFAPRFLGGYSVAKHGLVALAQQARLELADKGVHVTLCCPGPIARPDAGSRYSDARNKGDLPPGAELPGGGAKVKGLCPQQLAREILQAAARRELLIIRPRRAWWLRLISTVFPGLGERILRSKTS